MTSETAVQWYVSAMSSVSQSGARPLRELNEP